MSMGWRRLSIMVKQFRLPNKLGGWCPPLGCFWPSLPLSVPRYSPAWSWPQFLNFYSYIYLPNSLCLLDNVYPSIPIIESPHQVSGMPMRSYLILGVRQQVHFLYCPLSRQWHTDTWHQKYWFFCFLSNYLNLYFTMQPASCNALFFLSSILSIVTAFTVLSEHSLLYTVILTDGILKCWKWMSFLLFLFLVLLWDISSNYIPMYWESYLKQGILNN